MIKKSIISLLLSINCLINSVLVGEAPVITLEHSWTPEQIAWGLMQRKSMADNHGMLFHYSKPLAPTFWSFNCYLDLSVAFIDSNKVIQDIQTLRAYPEKMDPSRPVNTLKDMSLYRSDDPIIKFFLDNGASTKKQILYVLEMNFGWFEKNDIHVGDKIVWDLSSHTAVFKKGSHEQLKRP